MKSQDFELRTPDNFEQAGRYHSRLEELGYKVEVLPTGLNKVKIIGTLPKK